MAEEATAGRAVLVGGLSATAAAGALSDAGLLCAQLPPLN